MDEGDLTLLRYQRDQIRIQDKLITELAEYVKALEMALLALGGVAIIATVVVMYFILIGG